MTDLILGLDPGIAATGWSVIEQSGSRLRLIASGTIKTTRRVGMRAASDRARCEEVAAQLLAVARLYGVTTAALEDFEYQGEQTRRSTAQAAMGRLESKLVGMLRSELEKDPPIYTTQACKRALGVRRKAHVPEAVRVLLGVKLVGPRGGVRTHENDACAVAVCHANKLRQERALGGAA